MNSFNGIGRPTKDIAASYTTDGLAVAKFTLAVDRQSKGADFIPCVAFGKTADTMGKYCRKGKLIAVNGRIQTGSYEGKNGKVYTVEVVVNHFEFCEPKELDHGSEAKTDMDGYLPVPDGMDIPFI